MEVAQRSAEVMSTYISMTAGCCPGCSSDPCTPPSVPLPTLQHEYIASTLTKCGFDEFVSPSTPPKKYRTSTLSGFQRFAILDCTNGAFYENDYFNYDGSYTSARVTCAVTNNQTFRCERGPYISANVPWGIPTYGIGYNDGASYVVTQTTQCITGLNLCGGTSVPTTDCGNAYSTDGKVTGSICGTLSDEYTTPELIVDVQSILPNYSGVFSNGSLVSSYCSLSSDEWTYTIRRRKFKFILPDLTGYSCYQIRWVYRYTRSSDSATVDFDSNYWIWDGYSTESPVFGYGYTDYEYEPCKFSNTYFGGIGGPGYITIVNVTAICSCTPP